MSVPKDMKHLINQGEEWQATKDFAPFESVEENCLLRARHIDWLGDPAVPKESRLSVGQ